MAEFFNSDCAKLVAEWDRQQHQQQQHHQQRQPAPPNHLRLIYTNPEPTELDLPLVA